MKIKTDGNLHGSQIYDNDGKLVGTIDEVSFVEPKTLTLVKIGNSEFKPTEADLDHWRQVFEQASADEDFKIFTHDAVDIVRMPLHEQSSVRIIADIYVNEKK